MCEILHGSHPHAKEKEKSSSCHSQSEAASCDSAKEESSAPPRPASTNKTEKVKPVLKSKTVSNMMTVNKSITLKKDGKGKAQESSKTLKVDEPVKRVHSLSPPEQLDN